MVDDMNPYQSPQSPVDPAANSAGRLTDTMIRYLKGVSPWLRFIGIVGFISCGMLVLSGIIFLVALPAMSSLWDSIEELETYSDVLGAAFGVTMGLYFVIAAVLYFFPSLFIYNFGSKIRSYLQSGTDQDLEEAFKNNKSFWKFVGILTIIALAFIPVMFIVLIIVGVAASSLF
jgi:hypothetical protein